VICAGHCAVVWIMVRAGFDPAASSVNPTPPASPLAEISCYLAGVDLDRSRKSD